MIEAVSAVAAKIAKTTVSLAESLKETIEPIVKESPVQNSMEAIENSSLETLKARNEMSREAVTEARGHQLEQNRENGKAREEKAKQDLKKEYPESEGHKHHQEVSLRDKKGNIVKDPQTGEARRVDHMVEKNGEIVKSVEVTSETAPKDAQITKENRIRAAGGNYIKDPDTGQLIKVPKNTKTEVRRYA